MRSQASSFRATLLRCRSQRRCISDGRAFIEDDRVLLRQTSDRYATPILTRPLKPGRRIESHRGVIKHDDIIGKRVRDVIRSSTPRAQREGTEFRLHDVTLDDYVRLSRRLVTPIYGADANLIVNLLDLHPEDGPLSEESEQGNPKLEILEAGTGHGALTLYLSRAIHAANAKRPVGSDGADQEDWKAQRQAIIHTIDVSPRFSAHAEDVVRGFRHGKYAGNVNFHVGNVSHWLETTLSAREGRAFLSHAILDLPAAHDHLATVTKALRTDGTLIIFNPSITQITACATAVKDECIPLDLDRVIELGVNGGSGGREWDMRFVRPRRHTQLLEELEDDSETKTSDEESVAGATAMDEAPGSWSMVCRPKVGERIVGGGFVGVWKKHRDMPVRPAAAVG